MRYLKRLGEVPKEVRYLKRLGEVPKEVRYSFHTICFAALNMFF